MSKLSDFITQNAIHPNRIILASRDLERRRPEDKELVRKKKLMKEGKLEKDEATLAKKPRSGRPVTHAALHKAMRGQTVSGPTKTRIVRAVNAVLARKKKPEVTLRDLF
jgi:hypothetical protein